MCELHLQHGNKMAVLHIIRLNSDLIIIYSLCLKYMNNPFTTGPYCTRVHGKEVWRITHINIFSCHLNDTVHFHKNIGRTPF